MDKTDDGGPAFPSEDANNWYIGMSLRDYFAGQAITWVGNTVDYSTADQLAAMAYNVADALLRERAK
jgi:hypothetical protein